MARLEPALLVTVSAMCPKVPVFGYAAGIVDSHIPVLSGDHCRTVTGCRGVVCAVVECFVDPVETHPYKNDNDTPPTLS